MKTLFRCTVGPVGARRSDIVVVATERSDGDFHIHNTEPAALERRQRAVNGRVWAMVDQVHGVGIHVVDPSNHDVVAAAGSRRSRADLIASPCPDIPIAIWAADCAPLVLLGHRGSVVLVHAGWRGLAGGIIDLAVGEIAHRGDTVVAAVLGPVIHRCCYAFAANELALVAAGVALAPDAIAGETTAGAPALDIPAAVAGALRRHDVALDVVGSRTACDGRWFSHGRGDVARHAVVVWRGSHEAGDAS